MGIGRGGSGTGRESAATGWNVADASYIGVKGADPQGNVRLRGLASVPLPGLSER
jgi:hypothetical protein